MTTAIVQALRDLGHFANTFTPHRIASPCMEPMEGDAEDFNSDLMQIARKVDAVIAAYGDYLQSHGIVSKADVEDCFRLQLQNALEGNATFLVTSGVAERLQAEPEYDRADHQFKLEREDA